MTEKEKLHAPSTTVSRFGFLQHAHARFNGGQRRVSGNADPTRALAAGLDRGHGRLGPLPLFLFQLRDFSLERTPDAFTDPGFFLSRVCDCGRGNGDFILIVRRLSTAGCAAAFCFFRVLFVR